MAIPEAQLETWSHQGAKTTSAATYDTVRRILERPGTGYASQIYDVFLQGSYANDTNIYADSDVDIVVRLKSTFQPDLSGLPDDQQVAFQKANKGATYTLRQFKTDVNANLVGAYGADVSGGKKALHIRPNGVRRETDVLASIIHRRYTTYLSEILQANVEGIMFEDRNGKVIVNYPQQHSANCTIKHQATWMRYKPMVRVFKNIRNHLVQNHKLADGMAPSYFIEGLLYNAPDLLFTHVNQTAVAGLLNWATGANRQAFVCANSLHYLHKGDPDLFWPTANCDAFLLAAINLWNNW
jgi:hypothetical protein